MPDLRVGEQSESRESLGTRLGIDKEEIDQVGIDKEGIDKVGRYPPGPSMCFNKGIKPLVATNTW